MPASVGGSSRAWSSAGAAARCLQPVELVLAGKPRSERHVGEQAERFGELRRRRVHPAAPPRHRRTRRVVSCAPRNSPPRRPGRARRWRRPLRRASPRSCWRRRTGRARRRRRPSSTTRLACTSGTSRAPEQPQPQAVGERGLLHGRQLQRRRGSERRRLGAVRGLLRGERQGQGDNQGQIVNPSPRQAPSRSGPGLKGDCAHAGMSRAHHFAPPGIDAPSRRDGPRAGSAATIDEMSSASIDR